MGSYIVYHKRFLNFKPYNLAICAVAELKLEPCRPSP